MLRRRFGESGEGPEEIRDRIDLLRLLAAREGCERYLEIGCNRNKVFKKIPVRDKVGVDPTRGGTHRMTSDAFFEQNDGRFDLIFIDGLHHADQVLRDVDNALVILNEGGAIVLHDCNPATEEAQVIPQAQPGTPWNGDVWKAAVLLRTRPDIDVAVGDFDYGCGVLLRRPNTAPLDLDRTLESLTYAEFAANRREWLRLLPAPELLAFF